MIKLKLFAFYIFFKNLVCPCHFEQKHSQFNPSPKYKVSRLAKLDPLINESSGLIRSADGLYWTENDGGGKPELYKIDLKGRLIATKKIPNSSNKDWEELTKDSSGNIYIGDFGNNNNRRKDLKIYKIREEGEGKTDTISFYYPDQQSFSSGQQNKNFDCEAFFWYKDSLYLFSKNRSEGAVKCYRIPASPGNYKAELFYEVKLKNMLTAAAIAPDYKSLALLSYGKIYFFTISNGKFIPCGCRRFARGQSEAITYVNDKDFLISNEAGKLFLLKRK